MSLEPAAATNDYAYILARIQYNLPYASDIANVASNTNTGVPGKHVLDLNGKLHNELIAPITITL